MIHIQMQHAIFFADL